MENSRPSSGGLVPRLYARETRSSAYVDVNPPLGYPYNLANKENTESNGILDYWRIITNHKKTLLVIAACGALIGFLAGLPKAPMYRARTSLEVLILNEDFMNMKQTSPITTTDYSYDTSESQTQVKILESDVLLRRVLTRLGSDPKYAKIPIPSPVLDLHRLLHLPDQNKATKRATLLQETAASRTVRVTPRTRILELTFDSKDPVLAADFANTLAKEYIEESQENRWEASAKTSEWLAKELNDTRIKLEHSEDALQKYAQSSGLLYTNTNTNISSEKLQRIQQELLSVTADRIAKQSRYQLTKNASPESLPDVLSDTPLRQTEAKLNDLRSQIANLGATYNPEYVKTKRLQAELDSLQAAFDQQRSAILERIKNDFEESREKEKMLAAAFDAQTRAITGMGAKSIQYNILKREVDSNRQLYDTMLQQLKQSTVASAMRTSNVRVIDSAQVPEIPFAPNHKMNTILGLVSALLLGSAVVVYRDRGDRTVQRPGEIQFWTNLPELGAIPNVSRESLKRLRGETGRSSRSGWTYSLPTGYDQEVACVTQDATGNTTWNQTPSVVAEAFRTVLASILFAGEHGAYPKVLVFTSTSPGDGKTTVTGNVAIAMAEIGRKVLLIDGDLRRPRIHTLFGVERRGLTDLLRNHSAPENFAKNFIQTTKITGLDIMASGCTGYAAELLYSPKLKNLFSALVQDYDAILIDTPPMLQMTDARVLGRLAEAVVLVARARQTTRDAVIAARQQLAADKVTILGCILNDWNPKTSPLLYYKEDGSSPYGAFEAAKEASTVNATA